VITLIIWLYQLLTGGKWYQGNAYSKEEWKVMERILADPAKYRGRCELGFHEFAGSGLCMSCGTVGPITKN